MTSRRQSVCSSIRLARIAMAALALATMSSACNAADERLSGPVSATVERVIDGDTLAVRVKVWIGQELTVLVRLAGVDVPEMKQGCEASRSLAVEARTLVDSLVAGREVILTEIASDKYFGRVVARVATADGADLSGALIADGLARPYAGGKRCGWCGEAGVCRIDTAGRS